MKCGMYIIDTLNLFSHKWHNWEPSHYYGLSFEICISRNHQPTNYEPYGILIFVTLMWLPDWKYEYITKNLVWVSYNAATEQLTEVTQKHSHLIIFPETFPPPFPVQSVQLVKPGFVMHSQVRQKNWWHPSFVHKDRYRSIFCNLKWSFPVTLVIVVLNTVLFQLHRIISKCYSILSVSCWFNKHAFCYHVVFSKSWLNY